MRPVRYNAAASLDGFITDAAGAYDWIPDDPSVDFAGLFAKVDTILLGRHSYEAARRAGEPPWSADTRLFVFSTTMRLEECPGATLVNRDAAKVVASLRSEPGEGEIWLFGGGALFRSLAEAGQVDRVEITVVPVMLGTGTPLIAPGSGRITLELLGTHIYPSGMVALNYRVSLPSATGDLLFDVA